MTISINNHEIIVRSFKQLYICIYYVTYLYHHTTQTHIITLRKYKKTTKYDVILQIFLLKHILKFNISSNTYYRFFL